jgi:xylitol oxidase
MRNWAGNLEYRARRVLRPTSLAELQDVVAVSDRLRPMGTRHSFSGIGDTTGDLVSVEAMPAVLAVAAGPVGGIATVTVDAGARYGAIGPAIHDAGFALENLPSLPHISVAGACATGTHGSGARHQVLSAAVVGMELVTADGSLVAVGGSGPGEDAVDSVDRADRADSPAIPLEAAAVSLGALGVVTRLTLRLLSAVPIRQDVYEAVPVARFDEALQLSTELADSSSLFTTWRGDVLHQVWIKRRVRDGLEELPATFAGGHPALEERHPIPGMPVEACTAQLGAPGPWHERLPHFRLSHTPSSGEELQSEYFVPRASAGAAFRALLELRRDLAPVVQVSEIRTIAPDDLWLSPAQGRDTVSFHFTWIADAARVLPMVAAVERALEPFEPRAHWAKISTFRAAVIASRFPHLGDFARLAARLDPSGKLRNEVLEAVLGAA